MTAAVPQPGDPYARPAGAVAGAAPTQPTS